MESIQNNSNVNLTKALLAGELDVLEATPETAITVAAQGLEYVYDWNVKNRMVAPDMAIDPKSIEFMIRMAQEAGTISKPVALADVYDPSLQAAVVKELGAYKW